jgi:hypothetical protein
VSLQPISKDQGCNDLNKKGLIGHRNEKLEALVCNEKIVSNEL